VIFLVGEALLMAGRATTPSEKSAGSESVKITCDLLKCLGAGMTEPGAIAKMFERSPRAKYVKQLRSAWRKGEAV
jgi:hypothetical protein